MIYRNGVAGAISERFVGEDVLYRRTETTHIAAPRKVWAEVALRAAEFASKLPQTDWRSLMRKIEATYVSLMIYSLFQRAGF